MKLDFNQLKRMALKFNEDYGDLCENLDKGTNVYTISFDPHKAEVRVHLQWPYFRNQVANEGDHHVCVSKVSADTIHLTCASHGVKIEAIVNKSDVVSMLRELSYEVQEDCDIVDMFTIWQNLTGWDTEV